MYLPTLMAYGIGKLTYSLYLFGKKEVADNIYEITKDVRLTLRRNTADSFIVWEVFTLKEYSHKDFDIQPTDTIVDIGAHIGVFTVYAARKAYKGAIFSFEPIPDNFDLLKKNKDLNNLHHVNIFPTAVSNAKKEITLFISSLNTGGHSLYPVDAKQSICVESTTLEDIIVKNQLKKIDYLKIDVEGAEFDIILHTPKEIFKKIDKIAMEYHDHVSSEYNHLDIKNYLENCGFTVTIKGSFIQRHILKTGFILAKKINI